MFKNKSKIRRTISEAIRINTRRNIEAQFAGGSNALRRGDLDPKVSYVKDRTPSPLPGFFKRGGLKGVLYQSHIRRAYV